MVPETVQALAMDDGEWIAAPVNVHSRDWVWANKAVLDANGISVLQTWNNFMADVEKLAAGVTPIVHGGQAWQDATIFDTVVMSVGGSDLYKAAFIDLDEDGLGSDILKEAFNRMAFIRANVDDNLSNRDWNLATAMVINGEADFRIMDDWAKGDFLSVDKVPGKDLLCFRFPGTQNQMTFAADQFVMFDQGGACLGNSVTVLPVGVQRRQGIGAGADRRQRYGEARSISPLSPIVSPFSQGFLRGSLKSPPCSSPSFSKALL